MKKFMVMFAAMALTAMAIPAMAMEDGVYTGLHAGAVVGGWSNVALDYSAGYTIDGVVGYKYGSFRPELEIGYKNLKIKDTGYLDSATVLVNANYDLFTFAKITPYISGGVGISVPTIHTDTATRTGDTTFAFKAGAGSTYDLTSNIALDVSYQFAGFAASNFGGGSANFHSHDIKVGALYRF